MCELCLVDLGDKLLNQVFLSTILQRDSMGNGDGTGFMVSSSKGVQLYKSKESASALGDLGIDMVEWIKNRNPVLAHVRAASKGMVVSDENAHPFEGERFVLAHNGRLYKKSESVAWTNTVEDVNIASDSLEFLIELEKNAALTPDKTFLEIINATMAEHRGKFAFLIYDKLTREYYVCRGSTADLHVVTIIDVPPSGKGGDPIGIIVNTKKKSLEDALIFALITGQIASGKRLYSSEITELKKDTVYKVQGAALVEVGELKENPMVYTYSGAGYVGGGIANRQPVVNGVAAGPNMGIEMWRLSDKIGKFMESHYLTIADIDYLFFIFTGGGMADATIADLDMFVNVVIPKISAPRKSRERLAKVADKYLSIYTGTYLKVEGLEYPWTVNTPVMIEKMIKWLSNARKAVG